MFVPIDDFPKESKKVYKPSADVPKGELDIFFRDEKNFLPEGKTFEDLTPKEKEELKNKYRFDPYRPGIYQGITGFGKMV